jgi:hypothetical protein
MECFTYPTSQHSTDVQSKYSVTKMHRNNTVHTIYEMRDSRTSTDPKYLWRIDGDRAVCGTYEVGRDLLSDVGILLSNQSQRRRRE